MSSVNLRVLRAGEDVDLFVLENQRGVTVRFLNYGGIITSIETPDRNGNSQDITLGCDTLEQYINDRWHLGALVGRFANRIAFGQFSLDGARYQLAINSGSHHLHGGEKGFGKVVWAAEPFQTATEAGTKLTHTSPAGDQGYPGELAVRVTYRLNQDNELIIDYHAVTDRATHVNLTQHTYFNLSGDGGREIKDHQLELNASRFVAVDDDLIPTGELRRVDGTPFDFRSPMAIGARIDEPDEQLRRAHDYDHTFVIDKDEGLGFAARLREPASGRIVEVFTTAPGIQVYSGNFLDGSLMGRNCVAYGRHSGLALEAQHFPDSPNRPAFPSTVLRPGEEYKARTVYRFS